MKVYLIGVQKNIWEGVMTWTETWLPSRGTTFSKHWGINERSILLKLPYVNIPTQFVHDILHVTLEGIFNQYTCLLIEYLCMNRIFSYKILNQRLASYSYSYPDSANKPQMLKRINVQGKNSLKQTAIGTLLLAYILPQIISPRMKMLGLDNEASFHYWNYLNLVNIVLLCTSVYIDGNTCGNIEQLMRTYLFKFKMYFPKVGLTPKYHYLQHLPMNIKIFGPGRGMWTLRFETKHSEFKAKKIYNFRNVPKTIAYRLQLLLCYEMLGSKGEFNKNFFHPGEIVDSSCSVKFTEVFPHLMNKFKNYVMPTCGYGCNSNPNDVKVAIASSFILNGCKYKPGICSNFENGKL